MNGIILKKKKLTIKQRQKLNTMFLIHGTKKIFCKKAGVSFPSLSSAIAGQELSEQIIDKIIKAL